MGPQPPPKIIHVVVVLGCLLSERRGGRRCSVIKAPRAAIIRLGASDVR